jgi:hypothetical protein
MCRYSRECDVQFVTNSREILQVKKAQTFVAIEECGWEVLCPPYTLDGGLGPIWFLGRSHKRPVLSTGMMWQFRKLCVHGCRILKWAFATKHFEACTVGVEIPESFLNAIVNARKGTINKYIYTHFWLSGKLIVTFSIGDELSGDHLCRLCRLCTLGFNLAWRPLRIAASC